MQVLIEKYETIGIASDESKLKLAAILFDKVYSIDRKIAVPRALITNSKIDTERFKFISEELKERFDSHYMKILQDSILPSYFDGKNEINREALIDILTKVGNESSAKSYNLFTIEAARQLSAQKVIGVPIFNETILYDHLENDYLNKSSLEKVEVTIINAPVIIASELDWDQIAEAKKDTDFNKKVKRFSVFINKNYNGKDLQFIIDDLSLQIEDYKETCSKHGIRLANETFKSLSSSKSVFGTLGVAFCALLAKMPEYALVSGAVGAVLEVLNLKVTVRQYQDSFESFVKDSPISLIVDIDKMMVQKTLTEANKSLPK